jgi:hypothetical protein
MKTWLRFGLLAVLLIGLVVPGMAQQKKAGVVTDPAELKTMIPTNFFFEGQIAPVQARNATAIRLANGKSVVVGLVDNSGYSSDVAKKYQGFLITEAPLTIGDKKLAPGQYGFGFVDGKFGILDASDTEVLSVSSAVDEALKRPQPLKVTADGSSYRLYAGKKYVKFAAK